MGFGYEGPRIRLAPIERSKHFENAYRWINDMEVTHNLALGYRSMTLGDQESWFASMAGDESNRIFAIELLTGEHIGMSGLHEINYRLGHAKSGSYIADPDFRGKGYGTEAAHIRAAVAFDLMNLRIIYSEYYEGNEGSRRMQEKLGYQQWGLMPEGNYKNGQFVNVVCTALRKDDWRAIAPDWTNRYRTR